MNYAARRPVSCTFPVRNRAITVLAVDDDVMSREFLRAHIEKLGHKALVAENGAQAIALLTGGKDPVDVVLMDREMPVMDGLSAVGRMKQEPRLRKIPVIMITALKSPERIQEGLDAGVFYYLAKPVEDKVFHSVLEAAIRESRQMRTLAEELAKHRASFDMIETCRFTFRTLAEAESLAAFMANCFPDPERALWGLSELMINAIEHGNLGLGYDNKTRLVAGGKWFNEVERLQQSPEYREKKVIATIAHKQGGVYVVIEDEGAGFDWKRYLQIDPSRAGDNHGRGIAQANAMSFDKLTYNEKGNKAVGFVSYATQLQW